MFLVDDVPYLIDKAEPSTLYRFPALDPGATVTLEKVGVLAGEVANLSGADLSTDRALLAIDTHTTLYVYQAADPPPRSRAGGRPDQPPPGLDGPARRPGLGVTNVEGVAFSYGGHDLNLLAENRDVSTTSRPPPTSADLRPPGSGRRGRADPGKASASRATRAPMTP